MPNKTKKILFIITQSEFGGAQRFLARLVPVLDRNKYDILVAAGIEGDKGGLLSFLQDKGINARYLRYLRRSVNPLFDFCFGLIEIFKLIRKERPDILFLCSSKAGALGSFAGRLAGVKKIIYRIGGWTFNDPWPKWKKWLYIWLEKYTARWKDYIVNNAESDRQQAIKLGIKPREKIVTIYNGIDAQKLEILPRERARDLLGIKNGFIVGAIASFYPTKGLKYLIEAGKIVKDKDIKFILIGEGQEKEEEAGEGQQAEVAADAGNAERRCLSASRQAPPGAAIAVQARSRLRWPAPGASTPP